MPSLTQASLSGLRWSAMSQVLAQLAQYGSFILLARMLAPQDFGTIASAMLAVGLVAILNELGMGAALIQRAEVTRGHVNACFWSNVVVGAVLCAGMLLAAPLLAEFFRNPLLESVLRWLAPTFPLAALCVLPKTLLEKELRFKELGLIEAGSAIANGGLAMAMALAGYGVWSVVAGSWVGYVVMLVAYWAVVKQWPGLRFSRAEFQDLFSFGASVLGTRVASYFTANVDYLIVGRLMGATALGTYSLAYKLVTMPMLKISHMVLRVAYPAFSKLQGDPEAFRRHYMTLVATLAVVIFPLLAGLALFAPEAIGLVFGPQWEAAVLPTRILCLVGALKAMVCSIGIVFMAKGRPDLELKLNIVGAIKLPIFLLIGAQWGVIGVATAYVAASLAGVPFQQHFANRLMGLTWGRYLAAMVAPFGATAGMAIALAAWRHVALNATLPAWAVLAGALLLAPGVYLGGLGALGYNWRHLAGQLSGRRGQQNPAAAAG